MDTQRQEDWKQLLDNMFDMLNCMGGDKKTAEVIFEKLCGQHSTIQQGYWRVMQMVIEKYADARYDGRNEASVGWCRRIKELNEEHAHHLPFI